VTGSGNSLSPSFLTPPFGFLPHRKVCRALRDEWFTGTSDGSVAKFNGYTRYCGNFRFIPAIEFGQNIGSRHCFSFQHAWLFLMISSRLTGPYFVKRAPHAGFDMLGG
jgi:hypothetical protein